MPPKKAAPKGPTTKTLQKEKMKVVEDRTFGLKNKNKSKAVQEYCKQVKSTVMDGGTNKGGARAQEAKKYKEEAEKKKIAAQKALLASLFKGVVQIQTTDDGTIDYKNTLCGYFKAGVCEKGKKCKYSHDLSLEDNRAMAIDLYADPRTKTGKAPDTIITCRDFLDAVEKNLYGFNWVCPNQADLCPYRHMLPQGYVLQKDKGQKVEGESEDEMTLEEKIEEERANLKHDGLTPVTLETFNQWKLDRAARRQSELEAKIAAEEIKGKRDRTQMTFMSGRALFSYNPDLFEDAEGAEDVQFEEDEEFKEGEDEGTTDGPQYGADEESKEESKQAVAVDADLFAGEDAAADEDVDFD